MFGNCVISCLMGECSFDRVSLVRSGNGGQVIHYSLTLMVLNLV